jgi:phosphoribosyl 1,2-cyclic phosphodiesterase
MVWGRDGRLLVDCGKDWLGRLGRLHPTAIVLSHAHEDHAAGIEKGAACAVYATASTWRALAKWPLPIRCVLPERRALVVAGLRLEAWPVEHSLIAPAVGFRIADRSARIFYVPDVARLRDPVAALRDIDVYIGDGATLTRSLVRSRGSVRIGHASIQTQLEWCANARVRRAVFTHCGSAIVRSDPRHLALTLRALSREYGVATRIAHDGMTMIVRQDAQIKSHRGRSPRRMRKFRRTAPDQ